MFTSTVKAVDSLVDGVVRFLLLTIHTSIVHVDNYVKLKNLLVTIPCPAFVSLLRQFRTIFLAVDIDHVRDVPEHSI